MSTYYYRTRGEGEGAGHPVDSALSSQTAIYRDHLGEFAKQSVTLQSTHPPFPAVLPSDSFRMDLTERIASSTGGSCADSCPSGFGQNIHRGTKPGEILATPSHMECHSTVLKSMHRSAARSQCIYQCD